jgi:hypothetical protein
MNATRWTSKHVKFNLPDILKEYDIVVWCDNKLFNKSFKVTRNDILKFFDGTNYKLINTIHNERNKLQDELIYTLKIKYEN